MKKQKEKRGAMEILWLVVFGVCLLFGLAGVFKFGLKDAVPMFVCAAVSLLMFFWRQHLRRKEE